MSNPVCQQKDIARALGISQVAVSLALRHSPHISEVTWKRVEEAAAKMGYQRNPFSSALRARRNAGNNAAYKGSLAWLTNFKSRDGWRRPWIEEYYRGACEVCQRWGYQLDIYWYLEKGISAERLSKTLFARGVSGILLPPQPAGHARMELDWKHFSVVRFGYSIEWPPVNLVTNHHFDTISQILHNLVLKGYKRIGFAMPRSPEKQVFQAVEGAYLAWQNTLSKSLRFPIYFPVAWSDKDFIKWVHNYRPDAIVALEPDTIAALGNAGFHVPGDIAVAIICLPPAATEYAGIDQRNREIGHTAATLLVSMVERGEHGIPENPQHLLLSGHWVDGATVTNRASTNRLHR